MFNLTLKPLTGKWLSMLAVALAVGLTTVTTDAEAAKRLGGGKSTGMQRDAMPQKSPNQATPGTPANPAAAPAAKKPGWLGPVAGLAAGLGLAALASHFGFGEELATMLMLGLLFVVVLAVVGFILRKRAAARSNPTGGLAYAGANPAGQPSDASPWQQPQQPATAAAYTSQEPVGQSGPASGVGGGSMIGANLASTGRTGHIPADFDVPTFVRQAKVQFVRLQAAHDAGNLDDIREFTSPEMFAELSMDLSERGQAVSANEVIRLDADVVDVVEDTHRYVVSVRFTGEVQDKQTRDVDAFDEIWHLTKPRQGQTGWVLSGIQQMQ